MIYTISILLNLNLQPDQKLRMRGVISPPPFAFKKWWLIMQGENFQFSKSWLKLEV